MNLDEYYRPKDSPIARNLNARFQGGFDFDIETDRGIISTEKIRDASITNAKIGTAAIGTANIGTLSFNQISGGTANFGGTLNGDGVVSVDNSAGVEVVRLDSSGIMVSAGTISSVAFASGTLNAGTITNSVITGGTVNPALFQVNGTSGADGNIVYVSAIVGTTPTLGTIAVHKGLITSIT